MNWSRIVIDGAVIGAIYSKPYRVDGARRDLVMSRSCPEHDRHAEGPVWLG